MTGWSDVAWTAALAVAVLLVPGLLVGLAARLRGLLLLGSAAPLSVAVVAVAAIVAGAVDVRWDWRAPAALAVALALLVAAARRVAEALAPRRPLGSPHAALPLLVNGSVAVPSRREARAREARAWIGAGRGEADPAGTPSAPRLPQPRRGERTDRLRAERGRRTGPTPTVGGPGAPGAALTARTAPAAPAPP